MYPSIEAHTAMPAPDRPHAGKIGPNAIIRMAEALLALHGPAVRREVFAAAGLERYLANAPAAMVDELEAAQLNRALIQMLGPEAAAGVARQAGILTGDYLLAHRIPQPAQRLLRHLPRRWAARLLVRAIGRHAWTFAGSGAFGYVFTPLGLQLSLRGAPIARLVNNQAPVCSYYAGTFERVFAAMLGNQVRVRETQCEAQGHAACIFEVTW